MFITGVPGRYCSSVLSSGKELGEVGPLGGHGGTMSLGVYESMISCFWCFPFFLLQLLEPTFLWNLLHNLGGAKIAPSTPHRNTYMCMHVCACTYLHTSIPHRGGHRIQTGQSVHYFPGLSNCLMMDTWAHLLKLPGQKPFFFPQLCNWEERCNPREAKGHLCPQGDSGKPMACH